MKESGSPIYIKNTAGTLKFRNQADDTDLIMGNAPASHTHALAAGATDVTATATEVNVLDGIPATLTATELGYVDGVTAAIQGQINGKASTVHTHVPADVTGTAVIDNDVRLTDARTPNAHTNSVHSGATANLLTGLTPTFSNWTTDPGTNADIVRTLSDSFLTTPGVGDIGDNTITYDLGDSRIRLAFLLSNGTTGGYLAISDDNITYYIFGYRIHFQQEFILATGKFRYLRCVIPGVVTVEQLIMQCYNIN